MKRLWKVFEDYKKVVDIYVPMKLFKFGKKFEFVRFFNIQDEKRMEIRLVNVLDCFVPCFCFGC